MTSVHLPRLLSLEDWDALPEDHSVHVELQEGVLIVTPRLLRPHARAAFRIAKQLDDQLPSNVEAIIGGPGETLEGAGRAGGNRGGLAGF